jgi:hypothetical protein
MKLTSYEKKHLGQFLIYPNTSMLVMMTLPVAVTVLGADKDTGINVTSAF